MFQSWLHCEGWWLEGGGGAKPKLKPGSTKRKGKGRAPGPSIRQFLVIIHQTSADKITGTEEEEDDREQLIPPVNHTLKLGG